MLEVLALRRLLAAALGSACALVPAAASAAEPAVAVDLPAVTSPAEAGAIQLTGMARAGIGRTGDFAVDRNGARSGALYQGSSRVTARLDVDTGRRMGDFGLQAAVGGDFATGTWNRTKLDGDKLPGKRFDGALPTQAWAGVSLRDLATLRAGLMTSQWGMGLVANDGNHALDGRRDDWFVLPTTGDRVARAQLTLQPMGRSPNDPLRGLFLAGGIDRVIEDANAVRSDGDTATQGVFAARMFFTKLTSAGLYYVYRDQTFGRSAHPFLRVHVLDGAFDFDLRSEGKGLRLQGECAVITGRTNLAPTPSFPEHDVLQGAAIARARWQAGLTGLRLELDAGWLSGDDNLDDVSQNAFKANPNFQQGILMFSQVLAFQSGRARLTATDPQYVGYPSADLDRIATNGSVTSAVTVFPKVGWKLLPGLEVYGGALLAWSPRTPVDPFSTRAVGGGSPRNYLSQAPESSMLGSEFDAGIVGTLAPEGSPLAVALRAEYGVLVPGGALAGLESPIQGGRLVLSILPASPAR